MKITITGSLGNISKPLTKELVEMNAARRGGVLYEDYNRNRPTLDKIKLKDFAKDFAAAFFKS